MTELSDLTKIKTGYLILMVYNFEVKHQFVTGCVLALCLC